MTFDKENASKQPEKHTSGECMNKQQINTLCTNRLLFLTEEISKNKEKRKPSTPGPQAPGYLTQRVSQLQSKRFGSLLLSLRFVKEVTSDSQVPRHHRVHSAKTLIYKTILFTACAKHANLQRGQGSLSSHYCSRLQKVFLQDKFGVNSPLLSQPCLSYQLVHV